MNKDDDNTYYLNQQTYDSNNSIFHPGRGYVHKHGNEIECNLTGKYVTMVSDMSEEASNNYIFSICSVGLFGYPEAGGAQDVFVRDETLPATVEIYQGDFPTRLVVPNIYPEVSNNEEMDINIRQADDNQISFVSIEQRVGYTVLKITASELTTAADYDL